MIFPTEVHSGQAPVTVEPDATRDKNIRYNGFPHGLRETLSGSSDMAVSVAAPSKLRPQDGRGASHASFLSRALGISHHLAPLRSRFSQRQGLKGTGPSSSG